MPRTAVVRTVARADRAEADARADSFRNQPAEPAGAYHSNHEAASASPRRPAGTAESEL